MLNLKEWVGSKKTKDSLVGVFVVLSVLFVMLYASGGDPEKFKALLEAAKLYVGGALALLGLKLTGQAVIDNSKVQK